MDATISSATPTVDLLRHLAFERIAPQWGGFLGVLGAALQEQLSEDEYRQFLRRLGDRFAQENPLPAAAALSDLEGSINRFWFDRQWGFVQLAQVAGALRVDHRGCPLPAALQVDARLAGAFLEGVYQVWLAAAGAPPELALRQLPPSEWPMHLAFELKAGV